MSAGVATAIGEPNFTAIAFFVVFVVVTIGITWWAARKTATTEEFFAAGRAISGRPYMSLGPGIPNPPPINNPLMQPCSRHRYAGTYSIGAKSILGVLPHEYFLAPAGA